MPHTNGRIYSEVKPNGTKEGINTDDVGAVLSHASHDVATLCQSPAINMWARNKPEAIGDRNPITDDQRKSNNFGLKFPTPYTNIEDYMLAASRGEIGAWEYNRISPYIFSSSGQIVSGNGDWARLTDFDGYNHNAVSPFPMLGGGDYVLGSSSLPITLMAGFEDSGSNNEFLRMSDFKLNIGGIANNQLANYYAGVLLYQNNTHYWMATSDVSMSGVGDRLKINITTANNMRVPSAQNGLKGFVFLANKTFQTYKSGRTSGGAVTSVSIVPISSVGANVNILAASATLTVNVSVNGANAIVRVENRGAAVTITPVKFEKSETGTEDKYTNATQIAFMPNADTSAYTVPAGSATSPSVSEKRYSLPIMGMSGYLRFVYNYYRSNSDQANNQRTAWTALFKPSQSS